MKERTHYF